MTRIFFYHVLVCKYIELKFLGSNLAIGGASVAPYIELKCIFREVVNLELSRVGLSVDSTGLVDV